jgi:hypothetical protein
MSRPLLGPMKPTHITLDTLPQLFAYHRARFGGWSMNANDTTDSDKGGGGEGSPVQRPDGVSEEEWSALGDPGRTAILREREARQTAERALAAARARPTPPAKKAAPAAGTQSQDKPAGGEADVAAIVQQAVEAALKPFQEREAQRDAEQAANLVRDAVLKAAEPLLHDASDALAGIDLTSVVDDQGRADAAKVDAALKDLATRKPHLAKYGTRQAPVGIGGGAPAALTDAEKVKSILADMQRATGVRPPVAAS